METKELIVGEYIARGQSAPVAAKKTKTIKKHAGRLTGVIAAMIIMAAGTVTVFALENRKAPENKEAAPAPVQKSVEEQQKTNNSIPANKRICTKQPIRENKEIYQPDNTHVKALDDIFAVGDNTGIIENQSEELIGILGYSDELLELYRNRKRGLPSYLTCKINPNFRINLTQQELSDLMTLVEAEAPKEDIYGKILVANVVFNRYLAGWEDSVHDVMFAKNQFTPTQKKWYWNSIKVTDSTREAVSRALQGEDYSQGALYFYAWEKHLDLLHAKGWRSKLQYLFIHDGHVFYK